MSFRAALEAARRSTAAHATLMASPGDRTGLLSAAHHGIGVGVALRDDTVTVVQNLTRD